MPQLGLTLSEILHLDNYELVKQAFAQDGEGAGAWGTILHTAGIRYDELQNKSPAQGETSDGKERRAVPFATRAVLEKLERADSKERQNAPTW